MTPVISLRAVSKHFGGIVVADGITLDLGRGEILGLIGPNGAGKTTLFNLICGVHALDSGSIAVNGLDIAGMSLHRRAREGIARTWQNIRLFGSMSVLDNMVIAPRLYPGERLAWLTAHPWKASRLDRELRERAMAILARMRLDSLARTNVNDIPYGQQKLIGLARALMNDGDCLLLDEPMAGVEGPAYETMKMIVRQEAAAGRAVCVVEHNVSFIKDLCNSAVFMNLGRILERGSIDKLLSSKTLAELYFGT